MVGMAMVLPYTLQAMVLPYTLRLAGNLIPQGNLNSQANPTPEANHTCWPALYYTWSGREESVDDGGLVC
jgi:hypothetical protein